MWHAHRHVGVRWYDARRRHARVCLRRTSQPNITIRRRSQVVRRESAKLLYAGSIPAAASKIYAWVVELVYTGDLKSPALTGLWVRVPPQAQRSRRSTDRMPPSEGGDASSILAESTTAQQNPARWRSFVVREILLLRCWSCCYLMTWIG